MNEETFLALKRVIELQKHLIWSEKDARQSDLKDIARIEVWLEEVAKDYENNEARWDALVKNEDEREVK